MTETVAQYMERVTKLKDDLTVDVARQIVENDPHDLGVVVSDQGNMMGVLAVSDIVKTTDLGAKLGMTLNDANLHTPVANAVTCKPDEPVDEVLRRMQQANVKAAIVVDAQNRPVGIFSRDRYRQRFIAQFQVRL